MKRTIDNRPGFCYVVNDEPVPGIYESMRVVKRGEKFKVKSTYNNTITGEWEMDLSAKEFDTVEEAIEGIQNPDTLGFRLGYGETRHH